jgi:hypothetical protein
VTFVVRTVDHEQRPHVPTTETSSLSAGLDAAYQLARYAESEVEVFDTMNDEVAARLLITFGPPDPPSAADLNSLKAAFERACQAYHGTAPNLEAEAEKAALRLIAAHALSVAPEATHMLMESSDQGEFMCAPDSLTKGEDEVAEEEWEQHVEEHEDLGDAAAWLTWGHRSWEDFLDPDHPFSRPRNGYYALDLRRIQADLL